MTRRTDWAEYAADPDAPHQRGRGGHGRSPSGTGGDSYGGDTAHDTDGGNDGTALYGGSGPYGRYGDESGLTDRRQPGPAYDEAPGSPYEDVPDLTYGDAPGQGALDGEAWPRGHAGAGTSASDGGSRRSRGGARGWDAAGGSDGSGSSRGRRRRSRTESSGEDGGAASSSRAGAVVPPADPVEQARAICLRLLTGTPRTRKQLADALREREIPDDAAEEVLSRFEEVGIINDSAFADAWVESRHHGRGLARRALARELRTKGVDSTLIDAAVAQLDSEQEEATARELVARKLRSTRGLDRDKRLRRLAGMLARKGYPEGMALRVVRQALEEEGEDTEFLGDEGF